MSPHRYRLPVSTRHAFALAFDLAARRDVLHSLVIPLLLQTPWILALGVLPPLDAGDMAWQVSAVWLAAQLGNFVVWLMISGMLRFRARSVFNTAPGTPPAPAVECYARGLGRVPWLVVTEILRNLVLVLSAFFFLVPALFVGFRLSFATEAVVLSEPHLAGAFRRSFKLTEGRFERWLEMIVVSVVLVFSAIFLVAVLSLVFAAPGFNAWLAVTQLLIAAMMPIIQYAWTFFYLRLIEVEDASPGVEVGPAYATATPSWTGGTLAPVTGMDPPDPVPPDPAPAADDPHPGGSRNLPA